MMDSYSESFKALVKFSEENKFYIGTGNPSSKILIVGKEAAIDSANNSEQHQMEFVNNFSDWTINIDTNVQQISGGTDLRTKYNPIYPYNGQKNKIENKNTGRNGGTSRTWYYYQKLIDEIYNAGIKSERINFHEHCFITELNEITGPYINAIPRKKREESINRRKQLFEQDFFQQFPITIVAVGHYVRDFNIDLQTIFNVRATMPTIDLGQNNWINIHHEIEGNTPKLLIHTNQLSMIKSELIFRLGSICKEWILENNI